MGKNIVFLLSSLKYRGGAERVAVNYANWLSTNTSNKVYIVKFDGEPIAYELNNTVEVVEIKQNNKNRFFSFYKRIFDCKKILKKLKADIVFAMMYKMQFYGILCKPRNCIIIGSERNNIKFRSFFDRILCKIISKHCDGFIFQTDAVRNLYPLKTRRKSIVIPNAISNERVFTVDKTKKTNTISAAGRLTNQKGFDSLIKAFSIVVKKYPNYSLQIFGEGEDRNYLESLISELKLDKNVSLLGNVENYIDYVAKSKIFVLSSRYEGMPNVLIEAMACGVPCVSTNCDFGPSELINDGKNGVLVPVDDIHIMASEIINLLNNEKKCNNIAEEAMLIKNKLSPEVIYETYYRFFWKILHKKSKIDKMVLFLLNGRVGRFLSDKIFLKIKYRILFDRKLDFKEPKSFNEKLQWLKLNDRKDIYVKMVDKYEVKKLVASKLGEEYVIKSYGIYKSFDEINFDKLPNQFVLKSTHDSGGIVICTNKGKFNKEEAKNIIQKSLKYNYYYHGREWPYKKVEPRILVEKYMKSNDGEDLVDYKVMCFNGKPKMIFTCTDRHTSGLKVTFFDLNWNKLPFERHYPSSKVNIPKPKNLEKMIYLSKIMSKDMKFIRVDWYEIDGKLYFGEFTFYPGNGFEEFDPDEWDYRLGELIDLSK